jgi:organic hydroperoxide reductase OsmC/OhrA
MMGTLATVLAGKRIATPESRYWAEVEGDIEDINNVLKITQIRVKYHLQVVADRKEDVQEAFAAYLARCPAAQSVIGCIDIRDELALEYLPA